MVSRIRLGVNIDHVATVREARKISEPDPVHAAVMAEKVGADQITVHLREDRRHIQDRDVQVLKQLLHIPLNLEMAATDEMVSIALDIQPDSVTLVPERREEVTTEGGLDIIGHKESIAYGIRYLKDAGIPVALFVDPDLRQIKESKRVGAIAVELHTGSYCNALDSQEHESRLTEIVDGCRAANRLGLGAHAGHGLNLKNIAPIARINELEEVNIGHSIVGRSIFVGFEAAVLEMRHALDVYRGVQ